MCPWVVYMAIHHESEIIRWKLSYNRTENRIFVYTVNYLQVHNCIKISELHFSGNCHNHMSSSPSDHNLIRSYFFHQLWCWQNQPLPPAPCHVLLPFRPPFQPLTQQPRSQTDQGKKLWIKKKQRCFWSQMQFPRSPTHGCARPAQRVAGGCWRQHGSLRKHMPNLSLRKQLCLHQSIRKIFPPCAQSVGPWPGNMDPEGIPGGVLVPFLTAADKNQLSKSHQQGSCRWTAWSWSECASWGKKKVPEFSPVYISAESILIKLCKIKLHAVLHCFSSSLSTFRWRQKLMIEF